MSFTNQVKSIFDQGRVNYQFIIYTNDVLNPSNTQASTDSNIAIQVNTLLDIAYKEQVNVAYEPLEKSSFSTDSVQGTPYTLFLTGITAPLMQSATFTSADASQLLENTVTQLKTYARNTTLLTILKKKPLFDQYQDLHLVSFTYDLTPDKTILTAYMGFQETRLTDNSLAGTFPQQQVANPAYTSPVNNGTQSPKTPTSSAVQSGTTT